MKPSSLPTFSNVQQALMKTSLKMHASEAHGLICGLLCGVPEKNADWLSLIAGNTIPTKAADNLQQLYAVSAKQFAEFTFELRLLLPKDSVALTERAESLTVWCQGFLTGLKLSAVAVLEVDSAEVAEVMKDLTEIAQMDYEDVASGEEDEAAYAELVEYVRMAAILIYQSSHDREQPQPNIQLVH